MTFGPAIGRSCCRDDAAGAVRHMSDAVFGVKEGLLAAFCREDGPAEVAAQGVDGPCHLVEPDFVPSVAAG